MDIKRAKQEIKDTIQAYLRKDDYGAYVIPRIRQRPILLIGPPGVGKTQIMEQISQECRIGLVSYTITHHTRQSAIGLPFIQDRIYDSRRCSVTEYTMSEIIASVYKLRKETGCREGILFLDEINCVSETLAPSMLQFLQYKVFGTHRIPQGWIVVTAGNPPEYNKSVREFDVVTLDRMKILEVEAEYEIWREYAKERGIHTAILNYLDMKKEDFYQVETTVRGKDYVTARGWEDLSQILLLYEEEGLAVEETLVGQYLRNARVAREFTAYYDLYQKYQNDYRVEDILTGKVNEQVKDKARKAAFDERLSLMGMLIDQIQQEIRENMQTSAMLQDLMNPLQALKTKAQDSSAEEISDIVKMQAQARQQAYESLLAAGALSRKEKKRSRTMIGFLHECEKMLLASGMESGLEAFGLVREKFEALVEQYKRETKEVQERLHFLFVFVEDTFGSGNEMLVLLTECTVQADCAAFISAYGCEEYARHNAEMMLTERGDTLREQIQELAL